MTNFFEIEENKKTVKTLVLDDLSVEDLIVYIEELNIELERASLELKKKNSIKKDAEKFFR